MPASLAALAAHAQPFTFDHLPPDAGLSQSVVLDIVQDQQGFLWLATQDGLNRYDGAEIRVFKDDATPGGLRGNFIAALALAPTGDIWIATTDGGLNRYDPTTGRFTAYPHDPDDTNSVSENSVSAVAVDRQGIVWAGTSNTGLNRLDPRTGEVTRYRHNPADTSSLSADSITSLAVDGSGQVWVATINGGLSRLDPATGHFTRYRYDPDNPRSLSHDGVQRVSIDRQGIVWAGTFTAGLNRIDPTTGEVTRYTHDPDDPASLGHDNVWEVFEDSAGRLWVPTQGGGLNLLDRGTGRFTRNVNNPADPTSLSGNSTLVVMEDRSGILWVGTFGQGADYWDPYKNKFVLVRSTPGSGTGLDGGGGVWGMAEDAEGVLWVATNDAGLNRFDPADGTWRRYVHDPADPDSLGDNAVLVMYLDSQGTPWLGTGVGLFRFDRETETFRRYATPVVGSIYEDRRGNFWVGTAISLILLDRETGARQTFESDPADPATLSANGVSVMFEDDAGRFWLGTLSGGLNQLDRDTGLFTRYLHDPGDPTSLSSNTVLDIYQARDGTLWVGTTRGLNRFDPDAGTFVAYREKDGLPNDFVYGILNDDAGGLWLSTNLGLARFDPRTLAVKSYDRADGLQGSEFNQHAFFKGGDGVMYFGGLDGLNAFHPGLLRDNPFVPPVVLTGFQLYHRPVEIGPDSPLQQPVEVTDEIELGYRDGAFELHYAALHFSSPGEIEYAYRLDDLDPDWVYAGNRRFASYASVPPGDYVFRVRGTNSDGVWNEEGAALRIVIPPPFWQTLWFRAIVVLGGIGAISGGFVVRIRSVEAQRRRLEDEVAVRTCELRDAVGALERARDAAEKASRAKSVFLANMSHEFRTPLNAILGFTQIMVRDRRLRPDQREDLLIVHRSSEHLLGLINDVLEMSKIEAGRIALNVRAFDLHHLLDGLAEMFALRADSKGISVELVIDSAVARYVRGDEGKLRQVLMNLLGNGVKFTHEGGVLLRVQALPTAGEPDAGAGETLRFSVADTGPGIATAELGRLFQPFVQTSTGRESQEGTGLGLAISQQYVQLMGGRIEVQTDPGKGSTFWFDLPLEVAGAGDLESPPSTRRVAGLAPGQRAADGGPYRLLAVDDQEVNRRLLVKLFEPVGFEVREARNGQEAVDVWQTWAPHLIWMDMRMPVMDGYEATRRIKSTTRGMATIVIALTASALEEDRAVILSEGCDDYVRKPFRDQELFDVIARHLGVQYLYDEGEPETAGGEPAGDSRRLAAQLGKEGAGWLAELERAAILGDGGAIRRLAAQVADGQPALAEEMVRLADRFEHDRLLAAIEQAREGDGRAAG
jgi:signal transduction histidine kinase/ligand-binding sensor domain-containing protein/CheY-like chemotaxis protein